MTKWTAIVVLAVLAALVALVAWLRYEFSANIAAVALLALFGVVVLAIGQLLSLATQRATLNAIVDFQAADDRGEVARSRLLTEVVRQSGKIAQKDNAEEWRVLRQQPAIEAPDVWISPQRQITQQSADDVAWS